MEFVTVRQGEKYGPEYVTALKNQVPGLVCLGDDRPLRENWQGWFSKIEVFAPWNADLRPCLFFDLDTFVLGDLSPFDELDHSQFWLIDDFNIPENGESGLMVVPRDVDVIWSARDRLRGEKSDGAYLRKFPHRRLNREISGIRSYKRHCRDSPGDARIVCFHGRPKPPDTEGWAKDLWTYQSSASRNF